MSSGTEKFSVVFWKTGVSWQKWQPAEDCSTRARLKLPMPGRRWCVVWFAVRRAFDGRQIVVVGVLPTHQSSANHWQDTEAQSYVDNGLELEHVRTCITCVTLCSESKRQVIFVLLISTYTDIKLHRSTTTSFKRHLKTVLFNRGFAEYM